MLGPSRRRSLKSGPLVVKSLGPRRALKRVALINRVRHYMVLLAALGLATGVASHSRCRHPKSRSSVASGRVEPWHHQAKLDRGIDHAQHV